MRNILILSISFIFLFALNPLTAQNKWSAQFQTGTSFATQKLGNADLSTGFGFDGSVAYRFMPHLSAYAGWGWNHFQADESFAGSDIDFEETGYCFGLQFIHPIADTKVKYMIRAGGLYNHIEAENDKGDILADSKHGFGWQAAAGLVIPLSNKLNLMPNVGYRSLSNDIEIGSVKTSFDLSYVSTAVGIHYMF